MWVWVYVCRERLRPACFFLGAIDAVTESPQAILYPDVFDVFQSLLKHQHRLTPILQSKLLDIILSGKNPILPSLTQTCTHPKLILDSKALQSEIEAASRSLASNDPSAHLDHKTPLEMYAFLLQWFMSEAEKVAGKNEDGGTTKKVCIYPPSV